MTFGHSSSYPSLINNQEELAKFTVKISNQGEDTALGTGMLVAPDGLIATCWHVVKHIVLSQSKVGKKKYVSVSFSGDEDNKIEAEILEHYSTQDLDVAMLKIDKVPQGREAAKLGMHIEYYLGHKFESSGYRKNEIFKSPLPSHGIILSDYIYPRDHSSYVIRLESSNYGETGMSGSAVLDVDDKLKTSLVVGMMKFHDKDEEGVDHKAPYAIPVSDIIKTCPEIEKSNRGLLVYEFLNKVNTHTPNTYKDIDHLWVAPKEYEELGKVLEKDAIVVITGPPEYGKTYTAIRILWEYYHYKGYLPIFLDMEDRQWNREDLQQNIDAILHFASQNKKKVIVYLNDPFGKTSYTDKYVEPTRELINGLKEFKDSCKIIITSREKNFDNVNDPFLREIETIVRFDISKPSYDCLMREQILLMHAENSNCLWFKDKTVENHVLTLLKGDQRMLPTLLNIYGFVKATIDETSLDKLEKNMHIYSEYTPRAFAKEIKAEHYDLIEFLSFPFISDSFETEFVRSQYQDLIEDKKYSERYSFEHIAELFKDKISTEEYVRFRHPSYSEALPFLLEAKYDTVEERQKANSVVDGFSKVMLKLADDKKTARAVGDIVKKNFDKLQPEIRGKLLLKLAGTYTVSKFRKLFGLPHPLANTVRENFDKLQPEIRDELLLKYADDKNTARDVASTVRENFDKLQPEITGKLLLKLAGTYTVSNASLYLGSIFSHVIIDIVRENFDKLQPEIRDELLLKYAGENKKTAELVFEIIRGTFDKLQPEIRDELLLKLADVPPVRGFPFFRRPSTLSDIVRENFDKLQPEIRYKLISKLEKKGNNSFRV